MRSSTTPVSRLVIESAVLAASRTGLGTALLVVAVSEAVIGLLVLAVLAVQVRHARRAGRSRAAALIEGFQQITPPIMAAAVRRETAMLGAVGRWIVRRPAGLSAGAHAIGYGRDQIALISAFVVLTAGEVAAVELLVPWPTVRIVLLALGCYSLLIMTGFVAINRTRPHVLTATQLRQRRTTEDRGPRYELRFDRPTCRRVGRASSWRPHDGAARLRRRLTRAGCLCG